MENVAGEHRLLVVDLFSKGLTGIVAPEKWPRMRYKPSPQDLANPLFSRGLLSFKIREDEFKFIAIDQHQRRNISPAQLNFDEGFSKSKNMYMQALRRVYSMSGL